MIFYFQSTMVFGFLLSWQGCFGLLINFSDYALSPLKKTTASDCKLRHLIMTDSLPILVNIHHKKKYDVYIGRGSVWGNPFVISKEMPRQKCITAYKHHLWQLILSGEITIDMLHNLKGKVLGCFCVPQSCHGEVIIDAVRWAETASPTCFQKMQ